MIKFDDHSFILTAMRFYDNPQCLGIKEFENDLKRFMYLKKLLNRYKEEKEIKVKLIINHIIILHNLFGIGTTEMLFFKVGEKNWSILATFLSFLNLMPENIPELNINMNSITLDENIMEIIKGEM